ncbi:YD repeat-containing protein [Mucilaginibacter sp. OK268]|uniref:DUF5977 domain-containing protein n=1 Tax=Mucilaginibacter sp. OK268 TaxID=1881048 RepID=UPI000887E1E0|nr:DUF5977 domain-containing protein [Mucilaginibacter sp. OK268]SDQ01468.1 YD repeat-containing protein [Mucilaginibacter sp. OK268]
MKNLIIAITLLILSVLKINAQTVAPDPSAIPAVQPVMPGSPQTATLGKFGTYEVTMFNGLTNISIPIYTIKTNKLELPIQLKYHPSGIKVTDVATWVGLEWALETGGVLRRTVAGAPDELPVGGYLSNTIVPFTEFDTLTVNDYLKLVAFDTQQMQDWGGWIGSNNDGQPDMFSYSLNSSNGSFFFNKDKTTTTTMPSDAVKIVPNIASNKFDIIDAKGVLYRFGTSSSNITCFENTTMTLRGGLPVRPTTAWMLMEMISADKTDTIKFQYTAHQYTTFFDYSDQITTSEGYKENGSTPPSLWTTKTPAQAGNEYAGQEQTLKEIDFKNGKVLFDTSMVARQDFAYLRSLNKIRVLRYDPSSRLYQPLKNVQFYYNYFDPGGGGTGVSKRMRLDSVQFQDALTNKVEAYRFAYNTFSQLPGYSSRSRDYWGYYNGRPNTDLIPKMAVVRQRFTALPGAGGLESAIAFPDTVGSANRYPDPNYSRANMLTRIYYPTGGFTEFIYENNQYQGTDGLSKLAGGLRIRQITSFDRDNHVAFTKRYKYGYNENGYGAPNFTMPACVTCLPVQGNYITNYSESTNAGYAYLNSVYVYSSNATIPPTSLNGSPVSYPYVTEYIDSLGKSGKNVYQFEYVADAFGVSPGKFYQFVNGQLMITTVPVQNIIPLSPQYYMQDYSWKRGKLVEKDVYDKDNNLKYKLINNYTLIRDTTLYQVGFQAFYKIKPLIYEPGTWGNPQQCPHFSYNIETGLEKLTSSHEYVYNDPDTSKNVHTYKTFSYDPKNFEVSKSVFYNSAGEKLISNYTYPLNYTINGAPNTVLAAGIQNLQNNHIITPVIETYAQKTKADGSNLRPVYAVLTSYKSNIPLPDTVYLWKSLGVPFTPATITASAISKDLNYEKKIVYDSYAAGNITQQHLANGSNTSYVWGYNNAYPIAEIKNAAVKNVYFENFESGNGNSTAGDGKTGYYSHTGAFSKTLTGLDNGSYTLSWWEKSGSAWVYNTTTVAVTGQIYTISKNTQIDDLCFFPVNAQMSTDTFDPLIGPKSSLDAKSQLTSFVYDGYQRLTSIKDKDGNIVKNYAYNYTNQSTFGQQPGYGYNIETSATFQRACGPGYTGSFYVYTVPYGRYISMPGLDVQTQVAMDLGTNGQNAANANGTCTVTPAPVTFPLTNSTGIAGFTAVFSDQAGNNTTYNFPTSGTITVQIPQGTYSINIAPAPGNFAVHTFRLGSRPPSTGVGGGFSSVVISPSSTDNSLSIQ